MSSLMHETLIIVFTSSISTDGLQHLEADTGDVYLRRRNPEVEALAEVRAVCALDS